MISEDLNSLDFHLKRHLNILGLKKREEEEETNRTRNMSEVYNVVDSNSASVMTYLQQELGGTNSLSSSKVQKYKHFLDEADQVSFLILIFND
jgi:hypothetical protein